jgi:hypothetical protein
MQLGVVSQRHDLDRGRVEYLGATALEQGTQLFGSPGGGYPDGETRQRQRL